MISIIVEHLSFSQSFAITNNATMNFLACRSFHTHEGSHLRIETHEQNCWVEGHMHLPFY